MRIPLGVSIESRDGSRSRDAQVINGTVEVRGDSNTVRKRPGVTDQGLVKAGTAQLLYAWNGLKAIIGDQLQAGTVSSIVSAPVQTNLSPSNASLQFTAQDTVPSATTPRLFFKNRTQAWVVNRAGGVSAVTYGSAMGAGTYNLLSLTRTGGTATATLAEDVFNVGDTVTIAGATPIAYNGAVVITAVTAGRAAGSTAITITRSGTTATAVTADGSAHGLTNGNSYVISGAAQSEYNGTFVVTVLSSTVFQFTVTATVYSGVAGTFNPADVGSGVTLSNGNLTATATSGDPSVRGTLGKSTGKWYWEVTIAPLSSYEVVAVGIANAVMPLSMVLGGDANSWAYFSSRNSGSSSSYIKAGGALVATAPDLVSGDVVGIQLNMDLGTVTFYRNGSVVAAISGITGTIFPAVSVFGASSFPPATSVTANLSGGFTYTTDTPASPATGAPVITLSSANPTFSYTVAGSPATPATGTITAQGSGGTVPGTAYLNGTFYVMDVNGVIWNSTAAGDDPTTWPALGFIIAQIESGAGKAIAKTQNYVVAFKEYSTEFFYDAKQAVGSPLLPVENAFTKIGCANGASLAEVAGNLFFISQTRGKGRAVHMQNGARQQQISTPGVERILDLDDLATVYAYGLTVDGHNLYVLTLGTTGITLAYDLASQHWGRWLSYTVGSTVNVTSITRSGSAATVVTSGSHNLGDGAPVLIAGAGQGEYNGYFPIQYVNSTTFTINVQGAPATPATGTITATGYSGSYFKFTKAATVGGVTYVLHETNGHLYQMTASAHDDAGVPIQLYILTPRMDGGSDARKKMTLIRLIGDTVSDFALIRWSDDDVQSVNGFKALNLSDVKPEVRRCGAFIHRNFNLEYIGSKAVQFQALEVEIAP